MGSYALFAWRSGLWIADLLADELADSNMTLTQVHRGFDALGPDALRRTEGQWSEFIQEFLRRTDSQRESYYERVTKELSAGEKALFLVLCIVGTMRVHDLLRIRDCYRFVLAPGSGNRVTLEGVYGFAGEIAPVVTRCEWPDEVFNASGGLFSEECDSEDNDTE